MYTRVAIILFFAFALLAPSGVRSQGTLSNQAVSDAVEDELTADRAVPVDRIEVKTENGIVTLSGTVDNILAKDRASRIAETVKGVIAVRNDITVQPPDKTADNLIADRIKSALRLNPATDAYQTNVAVANGIATLSGTVNSFQERQLAEKTAKGVKGVRAVANNIDISYRAPRPDAEIEADIQQAFQWDALLFDAGIDAEVNNGVVKLSGNVATAAEKSRALNQAYVLGVKSIDASGLKVAGWDRRNSLSGNKLFRKFDPDIKEAIERKMLLDPEVNSRAVVTEVTKGVVTLRGNVDSLNAKRAAAEEARTTAGVSRVKNRIKVVPPQNMTDAQVKDRVSRAVTQDPYLSDDTLNIAVNNRTASLTGTVDTYFEKLRAEIVTAGVSGVTAIKNNLKVEDMSSIIAYDPYVYDYYVYDLDWFDYQPALSAKSDTEIKEDIGAEFFWSPFVDANQVTVAVNRGIATLTGEVDSWAELQAATENAIEGGATGVVNNLQISA